jgi:hypothetical protein
LRNGKKIGDPGMSKPSSHIFPSGSMIIDVFTEKTKEWISHFPEEESIILPDNLIAKIVNLHYCNYYQWIREDKVHDKKCEDGVIAQLKKEIDVSNLERCCLIEKIDAFFVSKLEIARKDDWSNLYINSQTLGEIIDKLSVLCLKRQFAELMIRKKSEKFEDINVQEIEKIEELIKYVSACYDRFLRHLEEGKGYMPFGQFKLYSVSNSHQIKEIKQKVENHDSID